MRATYGSRPQPCAKVPPEEVEELGVEASMEGNPIEACPIRADLRLAEIGGGLDKLGAAGRQQGEMPGFGGGMHLRQDGKIACHRLGILRRHAVATELGSP